MDSISRIYSKLLADHFADGLEMAFIAGPRQVGKTTLARNFQQAAGNYLSWDNEEHRRLILKGPSHVADYLGLQETPLIIFDEIHKYSHWQTFIKGFYDTYAVVADIRIIVTGSARLNIYRKGGDSLMGRYFLYRMHPFSAAELLAHPPGKELTRPPLELADDKWRRLLKFGGFPQPFLRNNTRFYNRWQRSRLSQVFREDIHDVAKVREIRQVELLAEFIRQQAGQLTSYASLAKHIRASEDSIRRWTAVLKDLYYCFTIRPWHTNIARSLRKEPKFYLWDWAMVSSPGAKYENMIASHLLKAVHYWTDIGSGNFELFFLRTKDKREVDFLVSRDSIPWFIVEVKSSEASLSRNLAFFQKITKAQHAFQVTIDAPFIKADCFKINYPIRVPAKTFLSQLV